MKGIFVFISLALVALSAIPFGAQSKPTSTTTTTIVESSPASTTEKPSNVVVEKQVVQVEEPTTTKKPASTATIIKRKIIKTIHQQVEQPSTSSPSHELKVVVEASTEKPKEQKKTITTITKEEPAAKTEEDVSAGSRGAGPLGTQMHLGPPSSEAYKKYDERLHRLQNSSRERYDFGMGK